MTWLPPGLDRAAGSAARGLLGWASGRRSSSDRTWVQALSAEIDEMDTGLDQLAWAVGVLPLVLIERGATLGRSLRLRLLWLASAGGLGGLRVYGPGVVAGIGMVVWSWGHRGADAPVPFFAAVLFAPFYVLRGLLAGRRWSIGVAAAVGAVTAVVGFEVVDLGAAAYFGAAGAVNLSVAWLFLGLFGALLVASVGAMCGAVGAALVHPTATVRVLRTAALCSLRGE